MKTEPNSNRVAPVKVAPTALRIPLGKRASRSCYLGEAGRRTPRPGRPDGFTIIEVLIAMVVLSIGMLSYVGMQGSTIGGNANARHLTESTTWASERIELLMAEPYASIGSGADARGNLTMTWTVTTDSPLADTKAIAVTMQNTNTTPTQTVTLNFIKSNPF